MISSYCSHSLFGSIRMWKKSFNSGWKTLWNVLWKQPAPCCKFNLTYTSLRQKHFHSTIDSQVMSRTAVWIQSRMFIPANGIQGQLLIYGDKDSETGSLYTSRWFNWAQYLENCTVCLDYNADNNICNKYKLSYILFTVVRFATR